jgi:CO/xanthine dehydrogenase Mo-binding subunit
MSALAKPLKSHSVVTPPASANAVATLTGKQPRSMPLPAEKVQVTLAV